MKGAPKDAPRCAGCGSPLWQLGGDPLWEGRDHSKGRPGTVISNDDETREVPACLECGIDKPKSDAIRQAHGLA